MRKLICATLAAAAAIASVTSLAATTAGKSSKKPTAAALGTPQYADMPRGKLHRLRDKIDLRDANAEFWRTHTLVPIEQGSEIDKNCEWQDGAAPDLLDFAKQKVQMFIEDDHNGQWLYFFFDGGKYIRRPWVLEDPTATHASRWIVSDELDNDWTYFVMFRDSQSSGIGRIRKTYHVEIFPPRKHATTACTDQRPPNQIKPKSAVTALGDDSARHTCETGSGDGTEPKH